MNREMIVETVGNGLARSDCVSSISAPNDSEKLRYDDISKIFVTIAGAKALRDGRSKPLPYEQWVPYYHSTPYGDRAAWSAGS